MTNSSRDQCPRTLSTDASVTAMWRSLMKPVGWHDDRVYATVIDAGRHPTPMVLEIDEIPHRWTAADSRGLLSIYAQVLADNAPGGSVAILLCRPGPARLTDNDRRCCRDLYDAGREASVALEVVHMGTDTAIIPVPLDEVLAHSA